jgi:hypothetical protein
MDRIKERTVRDEYRQILEQQLDSKSSQSSNDIEEKWMNIKQSIHKAAEEVLGTIQPKKRNGWFDQDCQIALDIRNKARKRMLQRGTRANIPEYVDARKAVKAICHRKKKEYEENIFHKFQDRYSRNEVRKFYERVPNIKRGFQPRITVCWDKIGNLIAGEQQILNRWAEYFEELLSSKTTQCMNAETISALNYLYPCPQLWKFIKPLEE